MEPEDQQGQQAQQGLDTEVYRQSVRERLGFLEEQIVILSGQLGQANELNTGLLEIIKDLQQKIQNGLPAESPRDKLVEAVSEGDILEG